jgi:DNA-binding response OmpR family regulator
MTKTRVLLVEDDTDLRQILAANLRARGHTVFEAATAHAALDIVRQQELDLLLFDINLPDQTGWDVLRDIVSGALPLAGPVPPVVILSGVRYSPKRLAEFHPLAYLPKPFPMEALLRLVARAKQLALPQGNFTGEAPVEQDVRC